MKTRYLTIWFSLAVAAGCGAEAPSHPKVVAASGIITYLGEPVDQAIVVFNPVSHKYAASAVTDKDGKYELQAFPPEFGAVPGSYTVTILKASQEDIYQEKGNKGTLVVHHN